MTANADIFITKKKNPTNIYVTFISLLLVVDL